MSAEIVNFPPSLPLDSPVYCTVRLLIGGNYWYAGLSVLRKVAQSSGLYCAARLLIGGNYWFAGLSVQRKVAQSSSLYCAARLLIGGNYWYAGLSVRGEYWAKEQLELKIRGQYRSDRLFSGQYCTSGVSQRYCTSPLDCLSHRHGTPQLRSTGQMKYRWETLTLKLNMKMFI